MSCSQPHRIASKKEKRPSALHATQRGFAAVCLLLTGLAAHPPSALAQQWVFAPEVEIAAQHIDNPRLQESGDIDTITGGLVNVAAALHRNTETSNVLFRPAAAIHRYTGDNNEDSEAFFLDFNAQNQGQRSNWRFRGNFSQQQVFRGETTSAEIDDIGVDDSVQTGTGRTFVPRERNLWRLGPGFTFDFTERTGLQVDFNYLDVQYDTETLGEAVDYNNSRLDAAIVYALSPDSNVEFGVFASRYEPDTALRETDSTGVRARYEKSVSDISTFFVEGGAQDSNIQSAVDPQADVSETSFLWNAGYTRQLERTRWSFNLGQAVTPSGSGALVERDLYRAMMEHQLQPRWLLQLSAAVMNTDTLGGEDPITVNERDYLQGRAVLGYQMTRTWTVEGLYSFTHQDFADLTGDAQEHELRLSLIYRRPVPTR